MILREGVFLEVSDGAIFEVKGLVHPPDRVIALPRYVPDEEGDRVKKGVRYRKVYGFDEREDILKERYGKYLVFDPIFNRILCEVRLDDITRVYQPEEALNRLREASSLRLIEKLVLEFAEVLISESGVSWQKIGVTGSLLVGLDKSDSDLDLVVYGYQRCLDIHNTLRTLLREKRRAILPYQRRELKKLYKFRSKDTMIDFKTFLRHEGGKSFQGTFRGRDFFIRYVKDQGELDEKYGDVMYEPVGYGRIFGRVVDDSEAIFTPCRYLLQDVEYLNGAIGDNVAQVISFRGRFCEQAAVGDRVVAQGKIERMSRGTLQSYQMVIGEEKTDYLIRE